MTVERSQKLLITNEARVLKALREARGMSMREAAKAIGPSRWLTEKQYFRSEDNRVHYLACPRNNSVIADYYFTLDQLTTLLGCSGQARPFSLVFTQTVTRPNGSLL